MPPPSQTQIHLNPPASAFHYQPPSPTPPFPISLLHSLLPSPSPTPLRPLPTVAAALNLPHVLLKDESRRFTLPSFKILGASWAVFRAVADRVGVGGVRVMTCSEGNWGRAVAFMGRLLGVGVVVYVPGYMSEETRGRIRGEGAEVRVVEGWYEDAVAAAREAVEGNGSVLVMDVGWEGYEEVPKWVVEGYQTMLDETDAQVLSITGGKPATHAVVPVGCGSIAQAVVQHYKNGAKEQGANSATTVLSVEPDTAACLKASLEAGKMTSVPTQDSIMCGMNCGALSTTAWPVLERGIDGAVMVTDGESHQAVLELQELGVTAGPCGAATLAALKKACALKRDRLGLDDQSVVVLFCTEGPREYASRP
ncbi:tryptophan synthase beta subunit-like PLP-dependent enzyme [Staphylotrichum tortipilum]|uniref:Tryptophan synthase beta subunit-like PLP-dependent enzyme n=1 Tax=Staphylotrichum tortipilum TaxID=2831512 RepID=A0AAN6MA27_9PEZI|nr:tryptophan synthase beta subunit-like PLP-dependent enzyme [Staphylotrichum longicolle]